MVGVDPKHMARDLRVAVDGGLKIFKKVGWKPHFAVGDWDSLGSEKVSHALRGVFHLTLPRNKDRSDLYYACRAALSAGANDLVCLGVTGGRPDHQLATLFDLSEISGRCDSRVTVVAVDNSTRYYFLSEKNPEWSAELSPGQLVSVFAMGGEARGVTLQGFKYPLRNAVLQPSSHGLSNRAAQTQCAVRVKKGRLVVMVL
jgi:thiamine pyrophosphokinase